MSEAIEEALSYDDVLMLPGYADFLPAEADVRTRLVADIRLNIPVISSAMDTVTEEEMAIAIALEGGAGVIHRNLSPESQAEQVASVKRFLNWIIDTPVTVQEDQTLNDVVDLMKRYRVSGLLVLNGQKKLCGIITSRDMKFCSDFSLKVKDLMTPNPIVEDGEPELEKALKKFHKHKVEKLPVVDSQGFVKGLITVKDIEKHRNFPLAALDGNSRLIVGAAVSPNDYSQRLPLLTESKVDFVVLDTAHGDSGSVARAIADIKKKFSVPVVGGNVATREGAKRLIEAGADAVKVGVGPGSICTTRIVAGIGVPQFSAVLWCAEEAAKRDVPLIADGGIKYSGDIVKAMGAGASAVMIGNLFAGLKEAPGREIIYEGRIFKQYRGMGSIAAIKQGSGDRYQMAKGEDPVPEGVEGRVPYKGSLKPFLYQLVTGLRKGMGYCGCRTIAELRNYRKFVRISAAGLRESHAHDVAITQEPPNYSR
ncbi:MAG: IMP dehydrogenase [Spirochaetales bacterium]|jgi:IMP dehydrogenase|nr:IMP dehydrogenase [Spirochaetales bacterium]